MFYIRIDDKVKQAMIYHTLENPTRECGGFLYGNYYQDINDIFCDINGIYYEKIFGSECEFRFGISYIVNALKAEKQLEPQMLMGTYHSHGQYPAIFSEVDRNQLQKYFGPNKITMIYSPRYSQLVGEFLDEDYVSHKAKILTRNNR